MSKLPVTTAARYPISVESEDADVGTAAELVVALDVLQGQHDHLVLQQLRPHLAEILGGPKGLHAVLRVLAPDDQLYLVDALGPDLRRVVRDALSLRDLLAALADVRVEQRLLQTLGSPGLRALIGSAEELAEVLEWVYGDCDRLVLDLLGARFLKGLFKSGYDLSLVLHSLDKTRQQELLDEVLGWDGVPSLVRDRRDLGHLLRALPGDLSQRLLSHVPAERLGRIVGGDEGWHYLHRYLEADEAAYLRQRLEVQSHAQ
jgi:hypothetical protein